MDNVQEALNTSPATYSDGNYGQLMLDRMWIQRDLRNYCDVILHVDDEQYSAHRNVLAACSPYLESVLSQTDQTPEHIVISCGENRIFESVLNYMYSGKVTINKDTIAEILRLANFLSLTKLKEHCSEYLQQGIRRSNCFYVRDLADSNGLSVLLKTVEAFIFANILEIISHDDVLEISEPKLDFLISRSMPLTELQRVKLISRWTEHRVDDRKVRFPSLLTHILWQRVGALELCHFLRDTTLLNENEFCMYHIFQSLKDSCLLPDIYFDSLNNLRTKLFDRAHSTDDTGSPFQVDAEDRPVEDHKEKENWDKASVDSESTIAFFPLENLASVDRSHTSKSDEDISVSKDEVKENFDAEVSKPRIVLRNRNKVKPQEEQDNEVDNHDEKIKNQKAVKTRRSKRLPDENVLCSDNSKQSEKTPKTSSAENHLKTKVKISFKTKPIDKQKRKRRPRGCSKLSCDLCPFATLNPDKLKVHINAAHQDGLKFTCSICDFSSNWNREYYQHMKTHFPGPPHLCDRCGFSADRVQLLLVHQMDHTDERPHECKACGMKFKLKNNLVAHLRCHSGEKPFVCPVCDRSFATKGTLEQHTVTHSNQRPYLCDLCGFSTKYHSHLIAHKRLHTGDVFKCQYMNCDYSTPKRSQLACHMRCHMRIRSYTCITCGKSFVEKSHLVRHERVHLDDKPFKCDLCDYSGTRRDKLKEHRAKYHDDSSAPCVAYRPRKNKIQNDSQATARSGENKTDKTVERPSSRRSAKSAKTTKKVSSMIKNASVDQHVLPSTRAGHQMTGQSSGSGYGVLFEAAVGTESQSVGSYASGNLVSLPVNAYATLGLVPIQGNGFATIQINAISPVQSASVGSNLLNLNLNGHADVVSNGQVMTIGNVPPSATELQNGNIQSNGHVVGLDNILCRTRLNRAEQTGGNTNGINGGQIIRIAGGQSRDLFSNDCVNSGSRTIALNGNHRINDGATTSTQPGQILSTVSTSNNEHLEVVAILNTTSVSITNRTTDVDSNGHHRSDGPSDDS